MRPLSGPVPASNRAGDATRRGPRILMLPDPYDPPTRRSQSSVRVSIPAAVLRELGSPERSIRLRAGRVQRTAVPEATIHEHRDARRPEDDVRLATHAGDDAAMDAEPQPETVKFRPEFELWSCIPPTSRTHPAERSL